MGNTLGELTFGEFITVKRKQANIQLRDFAAMLSLSAGYLSQIERGIRPAPTYKNQLKLVQTLGLIGEERDMFFDLAAKTRLRNTIPMDIAEFVVQDRAVQAFLRTAIQRGYSGEDLQKLI